MKANVGSPAAVFGVVLASAEGAIADSRGANGGGVLCGQFDKACIVPSVPTGTIRADCLAELFTAVHQDGHSVQVLSTFNDFDPTGCHQFLDQTNNGCCDPLRASLTLYSVTARQPRSTEPRADVSKTTLRYSGVSTYTLMSDPRSWRRCSQCPVSAPLAGHLRRDSW